MTGHVRVDLVDLPRRVYTMGPRPLLVLKVSNRYANGEKNGVVQSDWNLGSRIEGYSQTCLDSGSR
jgi:hypothetical protein